MGSEEEAGSNERESKEEHTASPSDRPFPESSSAGPDLPLAQIPEGAPAGEDIPFPDVEDNEPATDLDYLPQPIALVDATIRPPEGRLPQDLAGQVLDEEAIAYPSHAASRGWIAGHYHWVAPASCHRPLFFEEVNLERYGYSYGALQPVVSAGYFAFNVFAAPYRYAAEHPRVCNYTLGHYRPGSPAPYRIHWPPASFSGTAFETGLIVGLVFVIP